MMVVWHLHRDDLHMDRDTVRGVLTGSGHSGPPVVFQTVERFSTRIPANQTYKCRLDFFHTGGYPAYEVIWPWDLDNDGRPDRSRLLIHAANAVVNVHAESILRGCIAPGLERRDFFWDGDPECHELAKGYPGVTASRTALAQFMGRNAQHTNFDLVVTENL